MKIMKKIFSVILIFAVIQLFGMLFVSNEAFAESFFDKVFSSGDQWKEMGGTNSELIVQNANGVFEATTEIYDTIRIIGIALFLINIVFTFVSLSMKNNGKDIAGMKLTVGFTFLLAVLFIFAKQIMEFLQGVFEQFESL